MSEGRSSQVPTLEMQIDTKITHSAYNLQWQDSQMALIQSMFEYKYYLQILSFHTDLVLMLILL